MIGTWRWNISLSICGVLLTLLFSLGSNGLEVTLLRCIYAFIAFFALAFLFRALLAVIMRPGATASDQSMQPTGETRGSTVDLSTPDESGELNELLKKQLDGNRKPDEELPPFQPMTPPKLVSTQNKDPEELAKAIRHLTGGEDNDRT